MKDNSLPGSLPGVLFILVTSLLGTQTLEAQKFKVDNDHTSIIFAISHFGLSYTYGRFNQCQGSFELVDGEPSDAGFNFKIVAKSIDTNNAERDEHLRGPDFFDTVQFPEISFETIALKKVDDQYEVSGDLKIRDKVQVVKMPLRLVAVRNGPFGKLRAGFFTKFTIKRSDFGMDKMLGTIGDNVSITFSFEGIREEDLEAPAPPGAG